VGRTASQLNQLEGSVLVTQIKALFVDATGSNWISRQCNTALQG
jgi:hypothetical protein